MADIETLTPNEFAFLSAIDEAPATGKIPRGLAANVILAASKIESGMTWEERAERIRGIHNDIEMPDFEVPDFAGKIEAAIVKHHDILVKERARQRLVIRTIAMGIVAAAATAATGGGGAATMIPALIAAGKSLIPLITGTGLETNPKNGA